MKYLFVILFVTCIGCKTEEKKSLEAHHILDQVVENISSLENENISGKTPIKTFKSFAEEHADKRINIGENDMDQALKTAKEFKHAFILVEEHTLVKISDYEDCLTSKSWGTCMPKATGYIKKGSLQPQNDYCNNIIGIPDAQKRTLYLFN